MLSMLVRTVGMHLVFRPSAVFPLHPIFLLAFLMTAHVVPLRMNSCIPVETYTMIVMLHVTLRPCKLFPATALGCQ